MKTYTCTSTSISSRFCLLLIFLFCLGLLTAQSIRYEYQSSENPYYWKNKKPHAAYWQQDVAYTIEGKIDDQSDVLTGKEHLIYTNNSPDTLREVYFFLFNNAQNKDSYLADLYRQNKRNLKFGPYRSQNLGIQIDKIQSSGLDLRYELDNTVMKVILSKPLLPQQSMDFDVAFKTYFEEDEDKRAIRNRLKMFHSSSTTKQYDMVHWYPRIAVYDAKFGWFTDQHGDHEFYGDFGSFDISLQLPSEYICEGTGELINEQEVLPPGLKSKIDIFNFKHRLHPDSVSRPIAKDGTYKTWKYKALNVHDVAYTFDPTYRIHEVNFRGIKCVAIAQEKNAYGWQNAAHYVAKIIETNSKNIGEYAYPKMVAADAKDGMEYPMITLNGGVDPGYRDLFIHELSHNWFFGMVGSNETYRAFLDEGFTQYYTADTWEHIEGPMTYQPDKNGESWRDRHAHSINARDAEAYIGYLNSYLNEENVTLNTHSDGFNGGIRHGKGYGQVYSKTATMLYNLRYVLGDSLFKASIQHYFNTWKMCHPYPEDFRNAIIQFTKVDLNWFFDQWLETSKVIDYKIKSVKKNKQEEGMYDITFERKPGSMQMPIDFTITTTTDSSLHYHIPNTWFVKNTKATVLPRWIGWDMVKPEYTVSIKVPSGIDMVQIDPSHAMADVYMPDNYSKFHFHPELDACLQNIYDRTKYELYARPSLWYNAYDGVKFGAHLRGHYLNRFHVWESYIWLNSGIGKQKIDSKYAINKHDFISVWINYKTSTRRFMEKSNFFFQAKELDGLSSGEIGFDKKSKNDLHLFTILAKTMFRDSPNNLAYLIYQDSWLYKKFNTYLQLSYEYNYKYGYGSGKINLHTRSPFLYSNYDYTYIQLQSVNRNQFKKINIHTRFILQLGKGNKTPYESMLYAAGANPEEMGDNKYTRSAGFFPTMAFGGETSPLAFGGGLNLRGYMGYLLPQVDKKGNYSFQYRGTSGIGFNTEIEIQKLLHMDKPFCRGYFQLCPYLFYDAGILHTGTKTRFAQIQDMVLMDAGIGSTFTIRRWGPFETLKPLVIRVDLPFFLNHVPAGEKDFVQFNRWKIGINRAF